MKGRKLTFFQHLEELRNRIIRCVIFFIIAVVLFYRIIPLILPQLTKPIGTLVFIYPSEAFTAKLTIAFFGGVFLSSPFILYQIWRFVSGGLKKREKKYAVLFGALSFFLFAGGCAFGYFIVLPTGLKFLISFSDEFIRPMLTVSKYISFVGTLTLVFGIIFQFPLVIVFLTKLGIVTPQVLSRRRREMIVGIFVAAALLTPPDVVSQILLAVPLLILYEVSIVLVKIIEKARDNR